MQTVSNTAVEAAAFNVDEVLRLARRNGAIRDSECDMLEEALDLLTMEPRDVRDLRHKLANMGYDAHAPMMSHENSITWLLSAAEYAEIQTELWDISNNSGLTFSVEISAEMNQQDIPYSATIETQPTKGERMSKISTYQIFDSLTVEERIDELGSAIDAATATPEEEAEERGLVAFRDEVGSSEWDYGVTFIPEHDFEEYAQSMAQDCGYVDADDPMAHYIDWAKWARDVQMDYSSIELDGFTFLYRA